MLLLVLMCLQFRGVCSASPIPQVVNLVVEYGESAILPCNGSAYVEEASVPGGGGGGEGEFRWEAMGEDVVYLQDGELVEGRRYQGRIQLGSDQQLREGDWSLVLDRVMLSDDDMYECIWRGRRTVSTVWLKVKEPDPERPLAVWLGDSVRLPCYIQVPKSQKVNDLHVWWTRNGQIIASLSQGHVEIDDEDPSRFTLWPPEGMEEFGLIISPVLIHDHGEYRCLYNTGSSEDHKPGIPNVVSVTVLGTEPTNSVFYSNETETTNITWTTLSTWVETETKTETEVETTESPSDPTSYPESTQPEPGNPERRPGAFQWENLPVVRIGLIAGVLVVTAVTLCILGTLQKI